MNELYYLLKDDCISIDDDRNELFLPYDSESIEDYEEIQQYRDEVYSIRNDRG